MKQKLLFLLALLCAVAQGAWAQNVVNVANLGDNYKAPDGTILTGTLDGQSQPFKIRIVAGATVTLRDLNIDGYGYGEYEFAGLTCEGDATIILEGSNRVKGFNGEYPAIFVPTGNTLTIKGSGSLYAASNGLGAGLGAGANQLSGNIVIESGTIEAVGGSGSAGIGSGANASCGNITIKGGTIVAHGGNNAAGIGGAANCPSVVIEGGDIKAYGGENGAGIGSGYARSCDYLIIRGGNIYAKGGERGAGIGSGCQGTIPSFRILGDSIIATGGAGAAGIGSGMQASCGDVRMETCDITAIAGLMAAGIGSGNGGICGEIEISHTVKNLKAVKGGSLTNYSVGPGASGTCSKVFLGGDRVDFISRSPFSYPFIDLAKATEDVLLMNGDEVRGKIDGNSYKVSIMHGATVTLNGANIEVTEREKWPCISCLGDVTILIKGFNNLFSQYCRCPCIYVPEKFTLTLDGDGRLDVHSDTEAACIGAGDNTDDAGNIVINGGQINALCSGAYAAAIGSTREWNYNRSRECGDITINGGTIYAASKWAAGIGSGYEQDYDGRIRITGGEVTAIGITGIGAGTNGDCNYIEISGGKVYARGDIAIGAGGCYHIYEGRTDYGPPDPLPVNMDHGGDFEKLCIYGTAEVDADSYYRALGGWDNDNYTSEHFEIEAGMKVISVNETGEETVLDYVKHGLMLSSYRHLRLRPCDHEGAVYTTYNDKIHHRQCWVCGDNRSLDHTLNDQGDCTLCGYGITKHTVHFCELDADYHYQEVATQEVSEGYNYILPQLSAATYSRLFSGWVVKDAPSPSDGFVMEGETLLNPTSTATMGTGDLWVYARYLEGTVDLSKVTFDTRFVDGNILTGTLSEKVKLTIAEGATVTLKDAHIDGGDYDACWWAGITCEGNATILLEGVNSVRGFHRNYPGIIVAKGYTLTIDGDGSLDASSSGYGAGIGAGSETSVNCGNIVILGGSITARGGEYSAAIGGGSWDTSCGRVTITDGVKQIIAIKGDKSPNSIGSGFRSPSGDVFVINASGPIEQDVFILNVSSLNSDYTVQADNEMLSILTGSLDGTTQPYKVSLADKADVTIKNMSITGVNKRKCNWGGLNLEGDAIINVSGENTVKGFYEDYPGIYVPKGKTLTIVGDGSLDASSSGSGAGIGGGLNISCGNILINGANITATGGEGAAGIGGGESATCGTITITDAVGGVTAVKGPGAPYSVGAGLKSTSGTVTVLGDIVGNISDDVYKLSVVDLAKLTDHYVVEDGALLLNKLSGNYKVSIADGATVTLKNITIGTGNFIRGTNWAGLTCEGNATIKLVGSNNVWGFNYGYPGIHIAADKTLTIKGEGSLNASSVGRGAGIGGGSYLACGNIVIESGNITATGDNGGAGIGGGEGKRCGDITILGGTIVATGGKGAAGIGGGLYNTCGNITIADAVTSVVASKGYLNDYSVGEGYMGKCGTVNIGGTVMGNIDENPFIYPGVSLNVDTDISHAIEVRDGEKTDVTFTGREFIIDSNWNTLCLPFSMTQDEIYNSPLAHTTIMEFNPDMTKLENGVLTLGFSPVGQIEAGKPYFVRWNNTDMQPVIQNPVFKDVTIVNSEPKAVSSRIGVTFHGAYKPTLLRRGEKNKLWMDDDVRLRWADEKDVWVKSTWCWFDLGDIDPTTLNAIVVRTTDPSEFNYVELMDGMKDLSVLNEFTGKETNFSLEGRRLSTAWYGSCAYTVCLPFTVDLNNEAIREKCKIDAYILERVTDDGEFLFTQELVPTLYAGNAYLVVVNSGSTILTGNRVELITEPDGADDEENSVIDDKVGGGIAGYWLGSFQTIGHDEAAGRNAYTLTENGTFQPINDANPSWQWPAFRAMFCANAGFKPGVYKTKYQLDANGVDEDEDRNLPAPEGYMGDNDGSATGITPVIHTIDRDGTERWFDLNGRQLNGKPTKKGVYINKGNKVVIK